MTITKQSITESTSEALGISSKTAKRLLESTLALISEKAFQDKTVSILNFGKFFIQNKTERPGRNPKTGEDKTIFPRKRLKFSPSNNLEIGHE